MVFVSLEGFLAPSVLDQHKGAATSVPVPHAERPPQAPVCVVVTPGSPVKPPAPSAPSANNSGHKRSRLRRATSAFSSLATASRHAHDSVPTALDDQFVVYVTDRDVHHKWVLAKTRDEYKALKKTLQTTLSTSTCRTFACCGPLRRIVASSQYNKPKRRWSDSRVVSQFGHCHVVQEYLNDLLMAVLGRDAECDATRRAWTAVGAFLDVEGQRSDVADKILLRTVGGDHELRRSLSEQLTTTRRPSIASIVEQDSVVECDHKYDHHHDCATDSDTDVSETMSVHDDVLDGECPICCADLTTTKNARLLCGHTYHTECVRVWLRMQHTCPVCRIPIEGM